MGPTSSLALEKLDDLVDSRNHDNIRWGFHVSVGHVARYCFLVRDHHMNRRFEAHRGMSWVRPRGRWVIIAIAIVVSKGLLEGNGSSRRVGTIGRWGGGAGRGL